MLFLYRVPGAVSLLEMSKGKELLEKLPKEIGSKRLTDQEDSQKVSSSQTHGVAQNRCAYLGIFSIKMEMTSRYL